MDSQAWQANLKQSENTSLDLEFRQILCIIKHYIPYVNSNTRLSLYRAWLEKLSSTHTNKPERNKYLIELARQIKSDDLFPPFHERPPLGPLPCLPEIDNHPPIALDAIRESDSSWPIFQEMEDISQTIFTNNNHERIKNEYKPYYQLETLQGSFPESVVPINYYNYSNPYYAKQKIQETFSDQPEPEQERNVQRQQSHDQFEKKEGEATIDKDPMENTLEDGSWCDLTDASTASLNVATMGSGDGEKSVNTRDCSENVKLETKIPPIPSNGKVDHFKSSEPTESRFPLKDTNFMSADWKKTIEGLQLRLTETLSQNNELKVIVDNLKANIKYESAHKDQLEMKLKRSAELHKKEVETLKTKHEDDIKKYEHICQGRIIEIEGKCALEVEEIKAEYEMRLRKLKLEEEHDKKEKDTEIHRLSDIIQQQCNRMLDEIVSLREQIEVSLSSAVPEEKMCVLHKCVSKMDKLFLKSEKEYMKRIEKLKQELALRDKVTQIHLKTQRAEIIARASAEKQKQLEEVVNNLEVKYIKMLEHHENQVMENRVQDEEKIEYLKELLQENDIPYNST